MSSLPYQAGVKLADETLGLLSKLTPLQRGAAIGAAVTTPLLAYRTLTGKLRAPLMERPYIETANPLLYQPQT